MYSLATSMIVVGISAEILFTFIELRYLKLSTFWTHDIKQVILTKNTVWFYIVSIFAPTVWEGKARSLRKLDQPCDLWYIFFTVLEYLLKPRRESRATSRAAPGVTGTWDILVEFWKVQNMFLRGLKMTRLNITNLIITFRS